MLMKNANDTIWNRTRDLPTCSAGPEPTAKSVGPLFIDRAVQIEGLVDKLTRNVDKQLPTYAAQHAATANTATVTH
jgi:hypothetical protein